MDNIGLELLWKDNGGNYDSKNSVFSAAIHFRLIKSGLLCVGEGETFSVSCDNPKSECIPEGCLSKQNESIVCLRYRDKSDRKYVLKVLSVDGMDSIATLFRINDDKSTSLSVRINSIIRDEFKNLSVFDVFLDVEKLMKEIHSSLVEPMIQQEKSTPNSHVTSDPIPPFRARPIPNPSWNSGFPDLDFGRSDLDPLGVGGRSGMLMPGPGAFGPRMGPVIHPHRPGLDHMLRSQNEITNRFQRNFGSEFPPPPFYDAFS